MTDDLKRFLNNLIQKITGLYAVLITDRDGVPLVRVLKDLKELELGMKPSFLATFATATDQAGKLGLGKNQNIISMYSNYQIVQMNKLPLIVTFIGDDHCNVGHILAVEAEIDPYLDDIIVSVNEQ